MILDTLMQWPRYLCLSPRFERAFNFIERGNHGAVGRQEIDGDDVYAIVQDHLTKPYHDKLFEAHRQYLDIHYVIGGSEVFYWAPLPALTRVIKPYNAETDETIFALIPEAETVPVRMQAGQFAIVFPHDAHIPLCAVGEPAMVQKVVVKVRL